MTEAAAPTGAENTAPTPGSPEYEAAMAEKFRSAQGAVAEDLLQQFDAKPEGEAQSKPTRPDNVPEKFWDPATGQVNVEALLKSYTELESNKGKNTQQTQTQIPDPNAAPETTTEDEKSVQDVVAKAGLNWDDLGQKVASNGTLDPTDFEALEKVGIPRAYAEQHVALLKEKFDREHAAAVEYAGGEDAMQDLLGWAAKSLTPQEIEGYNKMLAGPQWRVALDTLKTRKGQTTPTSSEPNLVLPKTPGGGGSTVGYATEDEMRADMRNPLYFEMSPVGEKFRATVQEKVRLAAYRR